MKPETSIFGKNIRPLLRPVKDTQYADCRLRHNAGGDIRRTGNDSPRTACPRNPARTTAFREVLKSIDRSHDPFVDRDRGGRIIDLDMREYAVAI